MKSPDLVKFDVYNITFVMVNLGCMYSLNPHPTPARKSSIALSHKLASNFVVGVVGSCAVSYLAHQLP